MAAYVAARRPGSNSPQVIMTPLQLAADECANYQLDGACMGVMIGDDLSLSGFGSGPRCLVAAAQRCQYFEDCVMPMAAMATDPRRAVPLQAATAEYRRVTGQKAPSTRPCPDCAGPCPPRKRYCPACALKRRKAATRQAVARLRMSCKQLSQKTA